MSRRNIPRMQHEVDLFIHDRLRLTYRRPTMAPLLVVGPVLAAFPSASHVVSQRAPIGASATGRATRT
jgi:hypothetical protein